MLILQRKAGESLLIGEDIEITIVSVDAGGRVRLAIEAPKSLSILRTELCKAMRTNREAAEEEAPPTELLGFLEEMLSDGGSHGNSEENL